MGKILIENAHFESLTYEIVNDFVDYIEVGKKRKTINNSFESIGNAESDIYQRINTLPL